ncbi:MAG: sialate O-acetylesterase [Bradyrhizobium sp.]
MGEASSDPYALTSVFNPTGTNPIPAYSNRVGKTKVDCTITEAKTGVVVVFGQSIGANNTNDSYVVTNTNGVQDFSNLDGGCYLAAYPSIGPSFVGNGGPTYGSYMLRLGDLWINGSNFTRVIFANASIGSSAVADWATGVLGRNITAAFKRLSDAKLTPTAVIWQQGENDCQAATLQSTYSANLAKVISNIRLHYPTGPIFINQESWIDGTACLAITTAQSNAVNHASGIWAGADLDSITSTGRQADNTHLNAAGAASAANWLQTAMHAYGAPF